MSVSEPINAVDKRGESISELPKWLIAVTSAVLGAAGWGIVEWLAPDKSIWSFQARTVLLSLLGISLLYFSLGLLYLRRYLRNRTRIEFGIRWDMKNNPICSKCRGPLTGLRTHVFWCPSCKSEWHVTDRHGGSLTRWDAAKHMDEKYPQRN